MTATTLIEKINQTQDARIKALEALLELCAYRADDGHTVRPGDADFRPGRVANLGENIASELHDALRSDAPDSLNALLDRWLSANPQEADNAAGVPWKAIGEKLDRVHALVDPEGFLVQKVRDRPVGVPSARGLLNR